MLRILQKGGGKQLRAEFTVQEDAITRELSPQVVIFNLLLLDNETCKCSEDWILMMIIFAVREIKQMIVLGKV